MTEEPHMTLLRHIAEVWAKVETFYATDDLVSMLVAKFPLSSRRWTPEVLRPMAVLMDATTVIDERTTSTP